MINHEYFLFSRLSTFPWSRHCQLEAASIRCKFEKENKLMKRTIGWKRCKEKEEKKIKRKQRHLPLEITTNNLTEKNPKKTGASAFHFCMSEINRYFGYRRVNYLVHRIQPPIPKLRILNFHDFLFKTNQIVFVNPHWHELWKKEKCSSLAPHRGTFYKTQWAW